MNFDPNPPCFIVFYQVDLNCLCLDTEVMIVFLIFGDKARYALMCGAILIKNTKKNK